MNKSDLKKLETEIHDGLEAKYGKDEMLVVAIEELLELGKEFTKNLRGRDNREAIVEELADVEIVCMQARRFFNISQEETDAVKLQKLERTKDKI